MKHKFRFLGMLLPFPKHYKIRPVIIFYAIRQRLKQTDIHLLGLFVLWLLIWVMSYQKCHGQIMPAREGQPVQNITFSNVINYPQTKAQISDFRGKLLILDFWESWCKGCLVLMPKVKQLQQQYENRVQLLAVTAQQAATIEKLARTNPLIPD